MRRSRLLLCLLPALLVACSTVRVAPGPQVEVEPTVPTRNDRAATDGFPAAEPDGYRPPARLAVLLPARGSLAQASAGVRDGFLAAYYAETRRRPTLKFYDSQGTGSGAQAAAARAIADGAQMIVGPLTREEVTALSGSGLTIPVIALNRGGQTPPGTTAFALLPDDEGRAAADRLLARGLRSAVVFHGRSDNAQRALAAFRERLLAGGGVIASEIPVAGETPDLGAQLNALLTGPTPPSAVFMALEAGPARAIAAQLRSSSLAGLPRLSTSLLLTGGNARTDTELDGIEYPELPWLLDQPVGLPEADALARSLPSARGPAQRLFAFGADAWKLAAYFERLYNEPGSSLRGATGVLQIGINGPVDRTLAWAVISGGRGRPAPEPPRSAAAPRP